MDSRDEIFEAASRYSTQLQTGRYGRKRGIVIGFVAALLTSVAGILIGVFIRWVPIEIPPIPLAAGKLNLVWGVHATVISLSLVALSFAWDSIRDLPTSTDVIEDITHRLRSIETITFLLASNLLIGFFLLLVRGDYVRIEIAWAVGILVVASFIITTLRFWTVLELLLHNTLDETVVDFANAVFDREVHNRDERYNTYIDHFFQSSRGVIESNQPEQLGEKLSVVEDLLDDLLWHNDEAPDTERLWRNSLSNYKSLYRHTIRRQNEELQRQIIRSLSGLFWITTNYESPKLTKKTLQLYAEIFEQGAKSGPSSSTIEFLLSRFENIQTWVLGQFQDADSDGRLNIASELVDNWIEIHASMWKVAIEQELTGAIGYLHYLVNDVFQFRAYEYYQRPLQNKSNKEVTFNEKKQEIANSYRNELTRLRFAAYGWALHLNLSDDLSDDFLGHLFTEYVESDFTSVTELSNVYFGINEEAEILKYWERWNMDRELEESHGAATTGMATNTWLLRFYCTAMVWVVQSGDDIQELTERDPAESPLADYSQTQPQIDKIISTLDSYTDDFPIKQLLPGDASVSDRTEALCKYFEEVKSMVDKQEQKEVRELPISDDAVQRFEDNLNEQLGTCGLRSAIMQEDGIQAVTEFEGDARDELSLYSNSDRRLFVDTGIPTFFSSSFSGVIDKYREFVLKHLNMEEKIVDSVNDLPDTLANIGAENSVGVFVVGTDAATVIREDERSSRNHQNNRASFYDFVDSPVIRENTGIYLAAVLFEDSLDYQELSQDGPFSVTVKPGEEVDNWTDDELPEEKVPADFVQIQYSYRADIQSSGSNGVIIRLSE